MGYNDYSQAFQGASQQYPDVPPSVLSGLAWQESRYNPKAVGRAGEQGMMQFMPATAKGVGLSDPFDPNASAIAAARLLHQNLQATGGDMSKALQMYNGGTNPSHWNPAYASSVLGHAQQGAPQGGNPYQPSPQQPPQAQGQPPMPPQMPPMSLGQMAGQPMPQPNMDSNPMQPQPQSLGQMADALPQGNVPQKSHSKFTAGNIMGVLGDALSAYGGKQPTFGPFLREQQMMQQQQNFEMQKYQQQIAMQMYLMRNGLDTETGKKLVASGVQPGTPEWTNAMATSASNDLNPVVNTAQGPVLRSSVVPHYDPQAVAMLREAMAKGDHGAVQEFEEHFGRGSSLQALGQQ